MKALLWFIPFIFILLSTIPLSSAQNCKYAGGSGGINCTNASQCCGSGTMSPSCIADNSSNVCCQWYLSSTQCNKGLSCCGSQGYGASSNAFCCTAGTVCCSKSGDGSNTCCQPSDVCCAAMGSYSWCCPSGSQCGNGFASKCN